MTARFSLSLQINFSLYFSAEYIHQFNCFARFGLMHIVATNICVWIRTVFKEGIKDIAAYRVARGEGVSEDYMIKGDKNSRWFKLFSFILTSRGLQHSETEVWKWFILDSRTIPLHHEGNISRHRSVSSIFTSPIHNRCANSECLKM